MSILAHQLNSPSTAVTDYGQISNSKQDLPALNKVWGAVLNFFGQALKVEQADGAINYIKISELKRIFILDRFQGLNKAEVKIASKDAIIHDLFLSTINPMKGTTVEWKTLKQFHQLTLNLHYSSSNPNQTYASLREIRASLYTKNGMTTDQKTFINTLKVGDVIFHRTDDTIHSDIVTGQMIARTLGCGSQHRDAVHHNHVYMCAKIDRFGKKWFAEAAWPSGKCDEIRLISEDDIERCFITQNHGAISEIFRCNDQVLAKKAAEEACAITTPLQPLIKGSSKIQPTELRYSIADGTKALFISNDFGHMSKVRLIQQIRSSKNGQTPTEFIRPKGFFCSALVGYAYQTAEARPVIENLLKNGKNASAIGKRFQAHTIAYRHKKLLDQEMKFKIDPKRSTPGDLYSWMCQNKALFTSIQSYQQPIQ